MKLADICQLYTYIQTASKEDYQFWSDGGISKEYGAITSEKFKTAYLANKEDVWSEFRRILGGNNELED